MSDSPQVPSDPTLDREFDQAFAQLQTLVDFDKIDQMFPVRGNAVYTSSVVLWMLIYQRISPDHTLEAAVKKLIDDRPSFLPENRRITENALSSNTGAYAKARQRLPRQAARDLASQVSQSIIQATPPSLDDPHLGNRRVFHIDGTTLTLPPEEELQQAFPPAANQHGRGVWPVALLTVAHELASGAALTPQVGAMYGPNAVSETALIDGCLQEMPAGSLVIADSGYGIFAVAHAIANAGHAFLLRMTKTRFESLVRQAGAPTACGQSDTGQAWRTWSLTWTPSRKERRTHPDLPVDAELSVQLHQVEIHEELTLYLVTGLEVDALTSSVWYKHRTDVEVDIRNFKVVLDAENLGGRSVEMFYKELYSSMASYNLVTQFRRQAADLADEPPRRMSFKRIWTTYRQFLLGSMFQDAASWRARYRQALSYAMRDKLPNRPGRQYERESYTRSPKSSQFKKRQPKSKDKAP